MFVTWGPSVLSGPPISWSRGTKQISVEDYDQLYQQFNPTQFDADAWAQTAKAAGAKYLVLITKHHDGFCLWPSEYTDYDIMATPFKRDIVGEVAAACRKQGIAFGAYYSVADWYHPRFWTRSPSGKVKNPEVDRDAYMAYMNAQLKELIESYGPLHCLWFDISKGIQEEHSRDTVVKARQLQPDIIINNRIGNGYGDHLTPEQTIGGYNRDEAWESCICISRDTAWIWKRGSPPKTVKECLHTLFYTAGGDGNLLLNTGPMADGRIDPDQAKVYRGMGEWLERYGECIYGTRGGPYKPSIWGVSTCKRNELFLLVLKWNEDDTLALPALPSSILAAELLTGGELSYEHTPKGLTLRVAKSDQSDIATVIKLTLKGDVFSIEPMQVPEVYDSVSTRKSVKVSSTNPKGKRYIPEHAVDGYPGTAWKSDNGDRNPWIEVDLGEAKTIDSARIVECTEGIDWYMAVRGYQLQVKSGTRWLTIHEGTQIRQNCALTFDPVTGRKYRLYITELPRRVGIREFQLFEVKE
jgi:alpha-L-fucosidase